MHMNNLFFFLSKKKEQFFSSSQKMLIDSLKKKMLIDGDGGYKSKINNCIINSFHFLMKINFIIL